MAIRINSSKTIVDISLLSDEFVDTLILTFDELKDNPETILATYSSMFCGLSVQEIRDRFVYLEKDKAKHPCREYIRRSICGTMKLVSENYFKQMGENATIAPLYRDNNSKYQSVMVSSILEEEDNAEEENSPIKTRKKPNSKNSSKKSIKESNKENIKENTKENTKESNKEDIIKE